jgi:predicted Zn-dependent protease
MIVNTLVTNTEQVGTQRLQKSVDIVEDICERAQGLDLVGIYCAGKICRGFANSHGQRNWFETNSFNFDWSCYLQTDRAVKANYAGFKWNSEEFDQKLGQMRRELDLLKQPQKILVPDSYRVYLAPAAVDEILSLFKWGSFSEKAIRTKHSSFARMRDQNLKLASSITIAENMAMGVAPGFDRLGFIRPDRTPLIEDGALKQGMVSARTSREYGIPCNGAEADEAPCALELAAGTIRRADILHELDTGLLINNLWYINYSDRNAGRITGMTRFAAFWVKNGAIVGSVPVMRFDDAVYQFWGDNLIGLTVERDLCMSPMTYYHRGTSSSLLPGVLVKDFRLTL